MGEPSFRVNLPNNTAIGFRPGRGDPEDQIGLHTDGEYEHPSGEINFILPLTPMFGSNSLYVESEPGKGDYSPVTQRPGFVFRFYGNQCRHFNVVNLSGHTRVSL